MTAARVSVAGSLCDVIDLLRGSVALIDAFEGRDDSDELLAARTLLRLAIGETERAQELTDAAEAASAIE
jgi:hypothetical protein